MPEPTFGTSPLSHSANPSFSGQTRLARHKGPAGLPLGPGRGGAGQLRGILQAMEQAGAKVHLARPPGAGSGGGADDAGEEVVLGAAELEAFMQSQGLSLDDIAVGPGVAMGLEVGPGAGCHGHGHGEAAEPGAKEELRRLLRGVQAGAVDVNSKEVDLARQAVADEAQALERRMRDNRKTTRTLEALREKRRAAKLRRERKRRVKAQRPGPVDGGGGGVHGRNEADHPDCCVHHLRNEVPGMRMSGNLPGTH